MNSLEALNKLYFDNKDLHIDIALNDRKICEIYNIIKQDLEILGILRKHLYVASGLVELKITSQEYANIHKVKWHNGIPIVNQPAIDKINEWFYRKDEK